MSQAFSTGSDKHDETTDCS